MNKNSVRLYDDASFKSEDYAILWLPYHYHQHKYHLLSLKLFSNYHLLLKFLLLSLSVRMPSNRYRIIN